PPVPSPLPCNVAYPLDASDIACNIRVLMLTVRPSPCSTLFPYTTLFRSLIAMPCPMPVSPREAISHQMLTPHVSWAMTMSAEARSEEHTSELQSRFDLVCRLLLEKKKLGGGYATAARYIDRKIRELIVIV